MLFESGQRDPTKSETKRFRNFCWSRSTSGTAWIMPRILKVTGAVSSIEEHEALVYRLSLRFQALFCLRVFCIELKVLHPSIFSIHISTIGSGIKLKHLVPEDSEIMTACSYGDVAWVQNLLQSKRASVNDVTKNNHTPLMVR
jgi:hypothetical protein